MSWNLNVYAKVLVSELCLLIQGKFINLVEKKYGYLSNIHLAKNIHLADKIPNDLKVRLHILIDFNFIG